MFYELKITWRTICKEGFGSLLKKIRTYFGDLASVPGFHCTRRPDAAPEAVIKFL